MIPRVVYWNNIPAPYMVERFNALARRDTLDFEAWFSSRTETDRSWKVDELEWEFPYRYLPSIKSARYSLTFPRPLFGARLPQLLVSLYAAPSFMIGSRIAAARGVRTALWVEVTFDAWIERRRWKEALKSAFFPRADAILTAGADGRDFAMRYGASPGRILVVPHVIDFDHYDRGGALEAEGRDRVRAELGLRGVTFLYVGRLWLGKGLDHLLDAFGALQRASSEEVSLLLVGDGVDEDVLRGRCVAERLENVSFTGFRDADVLPGIYAAADVFTFPTLGDPFGMVVLEALACGLPVIATTSAGEIADRVVDGVNGFLVPPANSQELLDRMTMLVRDAELRRRMGRASVEKVAGQTPDVWAEAFEQAVEKILSMPRVSDSRSDRIPRLRRAAGGRGE
jgi:glycosyltransferase involved in cell wall biosynthesis